MKERGAEVHSAGRSQAVWKERVALSLCCPWVLAAHENGNGEGRPPSRETEDRLPEQAGVPLAPVESAPVSTQKKAAFTPLSLLVAPPPLILDLFFSFRQGAFQTLLLLLLLLPRPSLPSCSLRNLSPSCRSCQSSPRSSRGSRRTSRRTSPAALAATLAASAATVSNLPPTNQTPASRASFFAQPPPKNRGTPNLGQKMKREKSNWLVD